MPQQRIVFAVHLLCCLFILRFVWLDRGLLPGQFELGYFEINDGRTALTFDSTDRHVLPDVGLAPDDTVKVPPGYSVALPAMAGELYTFTNETHARAPFVVAAPVERSWSFEGRTLAANGAAVAWEPSASWRSDAKRLQDLTDSCAGGRSLSVKSQDTSFAVSSGKCTVTLAGRRLILLAGPDWISISRAGGWHEAHNIRFVRLFFCILFGAILSLMLTRVVYAVFGTVGLTLAYLRWPLAAVIGLFLGWFLIWLWFSTAFLARKRKIFLCIVWLCINVSLILLPLFWRSMPLPIVSTGGDHDCIAVGYSTVRGDALRLRGQEIGAQLNTHCAACTERTITVARGAATFSWVHDALYDAKLASQGVVAFWGGSNDDFLDGGGGRFFKQMILAIRYAIERPDSRQWARYFQIAADASLSRSDLQSELISETTDRVLGRHHRFFFLHDFVASDLEAGRDSARARLLEVRRRAVHKAGGVFIDLHQELENDLGVSWFNDFIHPSAIGHERVEQLLCNRLSRE